MLLSSHSSKIIQRKRPVTCVRRCHAISASIRTSQVTECSIRSACNHVPFNSDKELASAFKYAFQRILADDRVLAAATLQSTPASLDLVVFILAGSWILSGERTTHVRLTAACAEQPPIQFMGVPLFAKARNSIPFLAFQAFLYCVPDFSTDDGFMVVNQIVGRIRLRWIRLAPVSGIWLLAA